MSKKSNSSDDKQAKEVAAVIQNMSLWFTKMNTF